MSVRSAPEMDQFDGDHGGKSILHFEFEITIVCNGSMFNPPKIHTPRNRTILYYYYYLTLPHEEDLR